MLEESVTDSKSRQSILSSLRVYTHWLVIVSKQLNNHYHILCLEFEPRIPAGMREVGHTQNDRVIATKTSAHAYLEVEP